MPDSQRVVAFHQKEHVIIAKDCKNKAAGNCLCHIFQRIHIDRILPLQKLHSNVAVCLDFGIGQLQIRTQFSVIVQHPIVCKGKSTTIRLPLKRMVVIIMLFASLRGKACMTDHGSRVLREVELDLVGRLGFLECHNLSKDPY